MPTIMHVKAIRSVAPPMISLASSLIAWSLPACPQVAKRLPVWTVELNTDMENDKSRGRLRTVASAVWALPFVKKLVVVALIAGMAKAGVAISPEVAGGIISVADAIDGAL